MKSYSHDPINARFIATQNSVHLNERLAGNEKSTEGSYSEGSNNEGREKARLNTRHSGD